MLRVNLEEQRGDYLENLRPFILQVLFVHTPDPVTDTIVAKHILEDFGLVIPRRTVQGMLRRLADDDGVHLSEDSRKLRITGPLPDPGIEARRKTVETHLRDVILGLKEFSQTTSKPIIEDSEAVAAITAFLTRFDITCLSAYERGTAIPYQGPSQGKDIVLISDYVRHLQSTDPDMFERFVILVKGHMLANALMCPDLEDAPNSYVDVTFYLDTPLLVHWLGLEGEEERDAAGALLDLVRNLGGEFSVFAHTLDELETVIAGAAEQIANNDPWSPIAHEAIRRRTTATELRLIASQVEGVLRKEGIITELTPPYDPQFQIAERQLGLLLDDAVGGYRSDQSRTHDINSVRSIYAIRRNIPARTLESSKAVFLTSNSGFARAAWDYGRTNYASRHVSTAITDFSLANMAWLKTSVETRDVPITQVLAFSYAALRPANEFWQKYLMEIDRLQEDGTISQEQHILLRSYELAKYELMHLTLGEDAAFKKETITQAIDRVTRRFNKEADDRLNKEQEEHRLTYQTLKSEISRTHEVRERVHAICHVIAKFVAWSISALLGGLVVFGLIESLIISQSNPILAWALRICVLIFIGFTVANILFGSSVKGLHRWVVEQVSAGLYRTIAKRVALGQRDEN